MVHLIMFIATFLLGLMIRPILDNKYNQFIAKQYEKMKGVDVEDENIHLPPKEENPAFVDENQSQVGHSWTKAATDLENEKVIEKVATFVPPSDSDPEKIDVEVLLDKVEKQSQEEIDPQAEEIEFELDKNACFANGSSFEELQTLQEVLPKDKPTQEESLEAGRILYENQPTEMVEQLATSGDQTLAKINSLIRFYIVKQAEEDQARMGNLRKEDSFDYENFDPNSIFT